MEDMELALAITSHNQMNLALPNNFVTTETVLRVMLGNQKTIR